MSDVQEAKSISINSIIDKKEAKNNLNKPLATIKGVATSYFLHHTKYGENIGFKGDFAAVNLMTGEIQVSSAAFLPKGLTEQLQSMLDKAQGKEIEFACTIQAMPCDKNSQGIAWIADEPHTEERANRQQALLAFAKKESQRLLAAPSSKKKAS